MRIKRGRCSFLVILVICTFPLVAIATVNVYVTNSDDDTVSVIDTATNTVTNTIIVGHKPHGIAANPSGTRVYVVNEGECFASPCQPGTVSVINTATNSVIDTITVGRGPCKIAVNPSDTRVYVSNYGYWLHGEDNTVSVINTDTDTVIATVVVGDTPDGVAVTPDGSRVYVSNGTTISVIDTVTNTVIDNITGLLYPLGLAINPSGTRVYAANEDGPVSVIDTSTNTVIDTVEAGDELDELALNPSGTRLYVPYYFGNYVTVIDTATNTAIDTVTVGGIWCDGVAVTPDGSRIYVVTSKSNAVDAVEVIDSDTNLVTATVAVGNGARKVAIATVQKIENRRTMPWIPLLLLDDKILTGTWNAYFTETGGEEQGPYEIGIDHEGNSMVLCDTDRLYNGTVNGNEVSIDLGWTQFVGTIENDSLMQGTFSEGTWRMVKVSDISFCSELSFWDIDANGIPKFATSDHIELDKIERISKFRSGEGHDYSDDFESCRSMKHYYYPYSQLDWSQIKIFSPVDGTILKMELEGLPNSGKQVHIRSTAYPAFTFRIFHVNVNEALSVGDLVVVGQEIGTHISNITTDDIAVGVSTPEGWKLVSFFSVMTDTLFQTYQNRGAQSRDDFIISKEARDSDPLNCTGETFGTSGTIENWFTFQ